MLAIGGIMKIFHIELKNNQDDLMNVETNAGNCQCACLCSAGGGGGGGGGSELE